MIAQRGTTLLPCTIAAFTGFLATATFAQAPREERSFAAAAALKPIKSFDGMAIVRAKSGAAKPITLGVRNWIIPNRQKIAKFPEQGLLVIQVRAGSLVTIVDGKREQRGADEFWVVPPGATLAIETQQDSVILQVVSLRATTEGQKPR